jgi:hypothetical protein
VTNPNRIAKLHLSTVHRPTQCIFSNTLSMRFRTENLPFTQHTHTDKFTHTSSDYLNSLYSHQNIYTTGKVNYSKRPLMVLSLLCMVLGEGD